MLTLLLAALAVSDADPITIDVADRTGKRFDGLGGLSGGGATSR